MVFCELEIRSRVLGRHVGLTMLLPEKEAPAVGFRTLWLLHGTGGDETDWIRHTGIERTAEENGLAVVMPAGEVSRWTDTVAGGRYFTYVGRELPMILRDLFPLSARRADCLSAGVGSGGNGALRLALRLPERFAAAACLSPEEEPDCLPDAVRILSEDRPVPAIRLACGRDDRSAGGTRRFLAGMRSFPGDPFSVTWEECPGEADWDFWNDCLRHFIRSV